eukprot:CCRYP_013734-RC/>CCRYP_013734-RC protein AED:0.05 eAED:0.05 QI:386/1/1/1/0.62/0.55/9/209/1800
MRLILLVLCAIQAFRVHALVDIDRNGTVAENAFVDPDLSKDIPISEGVNLIDEEPVKVPEGFIGKLNELEAKLDLLPNSTQIDLKAGRVESITLAQPILPGSGVRNRLLWSVATGEDTTHGSPVTSEEWEEIAIQAVKNWMVDHASDLDVNVDTELFAEGTVRTGIHADGDMIQLHIPRIFKGIPVVGARAMATIKLGNLINVGFEDWGTIPSDFPVEPTLTAGEAYDAVAAHAQRSLLQGNNCDPELEILTMTPSSSSGQFGEGYKYVLAWRVCPLLEGQDNEVMEGLVDAQSGQIYSFVDKVDYFQAKGGVYPISNDKRFPDGVQQPGWPMPYMYVGNELTDTGGNYFQSGSVTASFNGKYVLIKDNCGSSSLSGSGGLDWGTSGGTDCTTPGVGGSGNTHSARTNVYELNKAMEMARSHLPNNNWLKQKLTVNLNINNNCNAFWGSGTINFYRSGGGCGNTGELAGVIVHEWGHGLDNNDVTGSIASPSGEGIADIYAALRMADSCIGRGFYASGGGCTGVRNIDYKQSGGTPKTFSVSNRSCGGAVHCVGQVYSQAVWSLYKRTLQSAPYSYDDNTALEIVTRLTFIAAGNINTWFSGSPPYGGCNSASGYREYLAADDDNGNINDGTPHMQAIFQAFNDQEIACSTPTVQDSGCVGTPNSPPQVTVAPGNMQAVISWTAVSGALNYQVFRTEGVKGCGQGKVKLTTTTTRSYTDSGLMNGREYYYIVIPKGPNDSCFGPASPCAAVTPTQAPVPTTPSPTQRPTAPTKNPTAQPTKKCGNGFCDMDEYSSICPVDCSNLELSVLDTRSRGSPGVMFWVKSVSRGLEVSSFKFYSWAAQTSLVQVYTRTGQYTGYELDQTGWELVHEATIDLLGDVTMTELTLSNKVVISSGTIKSFFIWATQGNIKYDVGTSEGALLGSDSFMEVYQGIGVTSKFSGVFASNVYSPRRFNGIIRCEDGFLISTFMKYPRQTSPSKKPVTSSPTRYPSFNPTKRPVTPVPTEQPTRRPTAKPTAVPSNIPTQPPSSSTPTNRPSTNPTSPPSDSCDNGTCESNETSSSCPQDCANVILTAHDAGTNGAPGIMFDLMASRDVVVRSFDFYTDAARYDVVEVYTRLGGYSGNELVVSGWTLIHSKNVTQMGRNTLTTLGDFDTGVTIRAGSTQSFFIYTGFYIMYDKGTVEGQVLASDASLVIYEGVGIGSKFPGAGATGVVFSPRVFKGDIRYDATSITVSPTKAPVTSKPTNAPSKKPVSTSPTKFPTQKPTSKPTNAPTTKPISPPPTKTPTLKPTSMPTHTPSKKPITSSPVKAPTKRPITASPANVPSKQPVSALPTDSPLQQPTFKPTYDTPSKVPITESPTKVPTRHPVTTSPTNVPSKKPITSSPTIVPTQTPTSVPTFTPSKAPITISPLKAPTRSPITASPTNVPSKKPITASPTKIPTQKPTPTNAPSKGPVTASPTQKPTLRPSGFPTTHPTTTNASTCYPGAKIVKLEATTNEQIQVFEVKVYTSGKNIATGGRATQSSTLSAFDAPRAIDDNNNSFSHTAQANGTRAWWQVDFGRGFEIDSIEILNRWCTDPSDEKGCLCRLSYANLSLIDDQGLVVITRSIENSCGKASLSYRFQPSFECTSSDTTPSPTSSPLKSLSPVAVQLPRAREVKLHSITGNPIQVFEVEIYSSGVNIARGKTATQSSTLNSLVASNAVDGNSGTFSHTTNSSPYSWWQVDLGGTFPIESIKVLNRWCGNPSDPNGCLCRLSHTVLSLFDEHGQWVATASLGDTCNKLEWTVNFNNSGDSNVCTILA